MGGLKKLQHLDINDTEILIIFKAIISNNELGLECTRMRKLDVTMLQFDVIHQLDFIDENFKRLKMAVGLDI